MTLIMRSLAETFDLLITCLLEGIRLGGGGQLYSTKSSPLKYILIYFYVKILIFLLLNVGSVHFDIVFGYLSHGLN